MTAVVAVAAVLELQLQPLHDDVAAAVDADGEDDDCVAVVDDVAASYDDAVHWN